MNKKFFAVILTAAVFSLTACRNYIGDNREYFETVFAMDTVMTLKAYGKNAKAAITQAKKEISFLDSALNRKKADGEIYKINESGSGEVSDTTAEIIDKAVEISKSTDGAFDITIAPVMDLWGFYTKEFYVPDKDETTAALKKVDYKNIIGDNKRVILKNNAQIDLGGIAKGYLSDKIAEIFENYGVSSGILSLGGNVMAIGKKPDGNCWNVAVENPDGSSFIGYLEVTDACVVTSGGYQRFFEKDGKVYHHIIDTRTGTPANSGLKSVSVICESGALADGLSTALFVMGLEKGIDYWRENDGFDIVFVTDDGKIYITSGIESAFSSENDFTVIKR